MAEAGKGGDGNVDRRTEAAADGTKELGGNLAGREQGAERDRSGEPAGDDRAGEGGKAAAAAERTAGKFSADHGTGSGSSSVYFQNGYSTRIHVAYMYRDWGCLDDCGDRWNVKGWIELDPGQRKSRSNPTENRWFYYFVEAVDGATTVGGTFPAEVRNRVFSKCSCLGLVGDASDPFHEVKMLEVDTDRVDGVEIVGG
jgi:hypothetical protein